MKPVVNRVSAADQKRTELFLDVFALFVVWALFCFGVGALAHSRGRSGIGFFLVSFLLSPLLGLIIVLVTKDLTAHQLDEDRRRRDDQNRESDRKREHEKQIESLRAVTAAQTSGVLPSNTVTSVADEISKLAALLNSGHLTNEEFAAQKSRLLGVAPTSAMPKSNLVFPTRPPENTERLRSLLSSAEKCKAHLISVGCRVAQPSEGVWEVMQPSGATAYARSPEAHQDLAMRLASESRFPGLA